MPGFSHAEKVQVIVSYEFMQNVAFVGRCRADDEAGRDCRNNRPGRRKTLPRQESLPGALDAVGAGRWGPLDR